MKFVRGLMRFTVLAAIATVLPAQTLNLSKSFVDKVKNQATLPIHFELDAHLTKPHPVSRSGNDGDIHMAGRADEVKLPMVVEIMNAADEPASVKLIDSTPAGQSIDVTGAWRIWFEHPSPGGQTQGDDVEVPANSNPDHVFEIHPVTSFAGDNKIGDATLIPIQSPSGNSYAAYSATDAFSHYEKLKSTIEVSDTGVSITSEKAGYNYTEFVLEPVGKAVATTPDANGNSDGFIVLADVYDSSDDETPVTAAPRRMVFINGTVPATDFKPGKRMHVLGIPRVNLAEVMTATPGEAVDMALPYEMIIVAEMPDEGTSAAGADSGVVTKAKAKATSHRGRKK